MENNKLNKEENLQTQNVQTNNEVEQNEISTKEVPNVPLSAQLKKQLETLLADLTNIKDDIDKNQNTILGKSDSIKLMLDKLKQSQDVQINKEAVDDFEKNHNNYAALAKFYVQELDFYTSHYKTYLEENKAETISIPKESPSKSLEDYILESTKRLKVLAKQRKKDVTILFSRYNHGFDMQLYRLNMVETHLRTQQN